jgi:hypothetical protein
VPPETGPYCKPQLCLTLRLIEQLGREIAARQWS